MPKVINLSSRKLTIDEIELLKKGLKFCPTPNSNNNDELKTDILEFCRKLRLSEKFFNDDSKDCNGAIVRNKSNWNPPKSQDKFLEDTIEGLKKLPLEKTENIKSNISFRQRQALKSLQNDKNIIIKEADKGGSVVVMERDYYCHKILDMLKDEELYNSADDRGDGITRKLIDDLITNHGDGLMDEEIAYLTNFTHQTCFFYGLPKVHKSSIIGEAIKQQKCEYIEVENPEDLKFRPIVGGPQSATHRLSHFIDIILKPLCSSVKSFIRDDFDFLQHLPKNVEAGSKLISFDIVSLYSNIPNDLGMDAIKYWLEKYRNNIDSRFDTDFIIKSLEIILKRNIFYFDGQYYQQKKGTAMGTKVAPTYATLVLGYLEEILYNKMKTEHGEDFSEFLKKHFWRFLDDCFVVWPPDINADDFHMALNSLHPDICYTMEISEQSLPFLDVLVKLRNNIITTDLYAKPTDAHNYLDFYSNHDKHVKVNIPFNLASRLVAIVSDKNTLKKRLEELRSFLIKQHYPEPLIRNGIRKAIEKEPIYSRPKNQSSSDKIIPFVSTYNPHNRNIFPVIKGYEQLMKNSERMKNILEQNRIINSKRQPKNLKRQLCFSKFESSNNTTGVSKCNTPRCGTCNIIIEGKSFTFKNGFRFEIRTDMTCKSRNVIYAVICKRCSEFYIGQTGCELRQRVTVHRQQTRNENVRFLHVNEHIHRCANDEFFIIPLYEVYSSDVIHRETKEAMLINLLNPTLNRSH